MNSAGQWVKGIPLRREPFVLAQFLPSSALPNTQNTFPSPLTRILHAWLFTYLWHFTVYQYEQHLIGPSQKPCAWARELTLPCFTSRNWGTGRLKNVPVMHMRRVGLTFKSRLYPNPLHPPRPFQFLLPWKHLPSNCKEGYYSEPLAPTPCHILSQLKQAFKISNNQDF